MLVYQFTFSYSQLFHKNTTNPGIARWIPHFFSFSDGTLNQGSTMYDLIVGRTINQSSLANSTEHQEVHIFLTALWVGGRGALVKIL